MSFVGKDNITYADSQEFIDHATEGLDAVLLAAGWEKTTLGEEVDATVGSEDRVYFSSGETGAERIFLRVKHDVVTSRVYVCEYGIWRKTGSLPGAGFNQVGALDVGSPTGIQLSASDFKGFISANRDFLAIAAGETLTPPAYNKFSCGLCGRTIPEQQLFQTTLAAPITDANTEGDVILYVAAGTDFTDIQVGQNLWLANTPVAPDYTAVTCEKVEVTLVDAPARKVYIAAPLNHDYDFGAQVALSPQPLYLQGTIGSDWRSSVIYGMNTPTVYGGNPQFLYINNVKNVAQDVYGNLLFAEFVLYTSDFYYGRVPGVYGGLAGATSDADSIEVGSATYRVFDETTETVIMRVV